MEDKKKLQEIERLLKELKASEAETAVTVEEALGRKTKARRSTAVWASNKMLFLAGKGHSLNRGPSIPCRHSLTFCCFPFLETRKHLHGTERAFFLNRYMDLNEMATAEAFTKVIVERQDNHCLDKALE